MFVQAILGGSTGSVSNLIEVVTDATVARTLSPADNGRTIVFTNVNPIVVTITDVGANALPEGFSCVLVRAANSGVLAFAAAGTVTFLAESTLVAPFEITNTGGTAGVTMLSTTLANLYGAIS